ncbi:iron complex outermembrane receptor protein [Parabacteroides sp. PF5-5]|uniref:TonB-dependent receptor n=1 Tax=unclassified Parabacteroides TaxID=2649774 RepID=UPI0024733037|nr:MULTISPECIES: TonB-dependent receptor [unclassified Parabacteroides]MDH6306307.1 iron complex outermembrane receptor protein [Parabacteroides sp. PH5-39]MDH6316902.1 iron complex outermembrane receptor protein [Parabacteroides sp. PF5-13]MDH6320971.1 iron complex outermembrane receptor protein [Parabacteroides sp. PH5-13]MDH6324703.1 iron complex outermembrane receptor protein [Parabacteroides sp. PH5-8]MDH6328087.1 iron complex outermembrane receptor protein [Parabacteroides sp. PH5-41]
MRIKIIMGLLLLVRVAGAITQDPDTLKELSIREIVITENVKQARNKQSTVQLEVADKDFLTHYYSGSLMQTLEKLPGVRSMDIGSGFSKPVIRGMGFNRVSVTENGIKQEGQQWGADHGLEIDALNVETVNVRKGPASLLYGSDAMAGVVEIMPPSPPFEDQFFGEATLLGKSVNSLYGGSLLLGLKKGRFHTRLRYSEQRFGDYRVPTDTIIYLTQRIPIYNKRLKNTAGLERNVNWLGEYLNGRYRSTYALSNAYQKVGFFPGAHGIPDASRVEDDGDSRNIDMPYSKVNHLKATTRQQYTWDGAQLRWDIGYQNNHREEWSFFHTHYGTQSPPATDPDKELAFTLHTFSSGLKVRLLGSAVWEHTGGWDVQYQRNTIGGYSFLLPEYSRLTSGLFWLTNYKLNDAFTLSGGLRYDIGKIEAEPFSDLYLATYLKQQGYTEAEIAANEVRSHKVDKNFGDWSGSLGIVWQVASEHLLKANIGHSFRLPGANELASNGVHHGTFRHEQGDASLDSERGWQFDVAYTFTSPYVTVNVSPFVSWFSNYIYLRPTGEWSILPHAGQVYRYTGSEALFAGGEASAAVHLPFYFKYELAAEYVYTYNCDDHIPLSFSPPATLRNTLSWERGKLRLYAEHHWIADQNRTDRNEDPTPGANLFHAGAAVSIPLGATEAEITLSARNLLNTKYYNHLSFYRKVEIPEPGRNFQVIIKVPFKSIFK